MASWNFGFVFTNLLLEALGSFSQACPSASLGSFSQNAVPTRHSPLAHFLVPATHCARALSLPFIHPRGAAERRDGARVQRHPLRAEARHASCALQREDARLSALHRGDFWPGAALLVSGIASGSVERAPRSQVVVPGERGPGPPGDAVASRKPRDATPRSASGPPLE